MATADLEIWVGRESTISLRNMNAMRTVAVAGANHVNMRVAMSVPLNILLMVDCDFLRTEL